jgi:ribosomal subunit interface protein
MNVQHLEKGVAYTDQERRILARKVGRLATLCQRVKDEASSIRVEATRRGAKKAKDRVKVMVTVSLPRKVLRAESRRVNPMEAVDRCLEKLEPQLVKYKELTSGRRRKALQKA